MNVFSPTSSPSTFTSGPPLLPGVDRRVCLNVDGRTVGVWLPRDGADDAHRDRIAQPLWTAEREHELALTNRIVVCQRQRVQSRDIDLEERKVDIGCGADDARVHGLAGVGRQRTHGAVGRRVAMHHDLHVLGAGHDMRVGDDVAVGIDDRT